MSKRNTMPDYDPVPSQRGGASRPPKKKKKKGSGLFGRIVRRFFLVLFTVIALILVAACLAANLIFNGPSPAARDILTMTLLEPSGTKWIPGLFMDAQTLDSIRARDDSNLKDEFSNASEIVINKDTAISAGAEEHAEQRSGHQDFLLECKMFFHFFCLLLFDDILTFPLHSEKSMFIIGVLENVIDMKWSGDVWTARNWKFL